jgi:NAD-dependent SIR2 family protein deacetylase
VSSEKSSVPDALSAKEYLASGSELIVLLGAGASVKAGVPASGTMTQAIAEAIQGDTRSGYFGMDSALNFAIGALLAHRAAEGVSPFEGLDVELLFSAIQMLADRSQLEVAAFVQTWHPAIDSFGQANAPRPSAFIAGEIDAAVKSMLGDGRRYGMTASVGKLVEKFVKESAAPPRQYPVYEALQTAMVTALRRQLVVPAESFDYLAPLVALHGRQPLTVATLNYDLGMEAVAGRHGVDITTGSDLWDGGFDWQWPETAALRLIKLHGSIDWVAPAGPRRLSDVPSSIAMTAEPVAEKDPPLVVFGQRGKVRADGPFLALLRAFEQALSRADRLLVVGYSLRDEHINTLLQRWLAKDASRGLVVVDPNFRERGVWSSRTFATELWREYGARDYEPDRGASRMFLDKRYAEDALADLLG